MDLPTYTSIWRIEKRLYKLYDFRLPMPLPIGQVTVFAAIAVPYLVLLTVLGLPFNHTLIWLYILPPGLATWLVTRPVLESKRLPELIKSQLRYLSEPRVLCRMAPLSEREVVFVSGSVWRPRAGRRRADVLSDVLSEHEAEVEALEPDDEHAIAAAPAASADRRRAGLRRGPLPPGRSGGQEPAVAALQVTADAGPAWADDRQRMRAPAGAAAAVPPASPGPGRIAAQSQHRAGPAEAAATWPHAPGRPVDLGLLAGAPAGLTPGSPPPAAGGLAAGDGQAPPPRHVQHAEFRLAASGRPAQTSGPAQASGRPAQTSGPAQASGPGQRSGPEQTSGRGQTSGPGMGGPPIASDGDGWTTHASLGASSPGQLSASADDQPEYVGQHARPAQADAASADRPEPADQAPEQEVRPARDAEPSAEPARPAEAAHQAESGRPAEAAHQAESGRPAQTGHPASATRHPDAVRPGQPAGPARPAVTVVGAGQGRAPAPSVERALAGPSARRGDQRPARVAVVPGGHRPGKPDLLQRDRARAQMPIGRRPRIVILGCTVGAGQTMTALLTGEVLASLRSDQVAVMDLNPGPGSLARRAEGRPALSQAALTGRSRLVVIGPRGAAADSGAAAGSRDPAVEAITFEAATDRYDMVLADPATVAVPKLLTVVDQLVLVAPASAAAPGAIAMTFEWLEAHGQSALAAGSVMVLNGVSRRSAASVEQAERVCAGRCRAIVRIPWDDQLQSQMARKTLASGPGSQMRQHWTGVLNPPTAAAYTALAGVLVASLAGRDTEAVRAGQVRR